jgi:hypothetical protein
MFIAEPWTQPVELAPPEPPPAGAVELLLLQPRLREMAHTRTTNVVLIMGRLLKMTVVSDEQRVAPR